MRLPARSSTGWRSSTSSTCSPWVPVGPAALLDVGPEVAYQEITANVAVTATTEAAAATVVTAPAFTADGSSQYLIEAQLIAQPPGTSGQSIIFVLYLDGVSLGLFGQIMGNSATGLISSLRLARRLTPAAGARTFSLRAYVTGGTGNVFAGAGGVGVYVPAFIRITKVPSAVAGASGLVPPTAIGTALPASPVDGQEFILTDSLTAPTYTWRLRYLAAKASNKWVFVGGSPLYVEVTNPDGTASATYVALATAGPSITVPVAGDYFVGIGFQPSGQATAQGIFYMIGGDWDVQGAESAMNSGMGAARGNFTSQIRQALIDLGVTDTSKLGSLGQYIDADTISKAAQNKYSQMAQTSQAETARQAQSQARLAAQGMLSSGQLTTETERNVADAESARYGYLRDFLGSGQQGLSNLADLNNQYASQLMRASLGTLRTTFARAPPPRPSSPPSSASSRPG